MQVEGRCLEVVFKSRDRASGLGSAAQGAGEARVNPEVGVG